MANVRVTPSGNLDKDSELSYINKGNYVDANDIRHRQTDGSNFGGVMGVDGNLNLITLVNGSPGTTLPAVPTTTKKYRIYLDYGFLASGATTNMDGILVLTDTSNNTSTKVVSISPSSLLNFAFLMQAEFSTLFNLRYGSSPTFNPAGVPYYTSTGTNTGYFTITIPTGVDTNYTLTVNNTNIDVPLCKIVLEDEYIATGTTLRPIGSFQLEDYLFVWSASELSTGTKSDISEIGVIYSTTQGINYQYKTLCRTSKLGFFKERRLDIQGERVGPQINLYWTDGNEKPRAMYLDYSLVTTQNGFMFWQGGRYEHDSIDQESSFFYKVPKAYIDSISVINEGGRITAGNKRYTGRFLTEDLVSTEFLYPTNPLNIYLADTNVPSFVRGDDSSVITDKSVTMVVRNIQPGIYKFFELVVIEYNDDAFTATVVQRYTINDTDAEINVSHVGRGQDNIPLGVNELLAIQSKYLSAESIRIHDTRVVLSNLKEQVDKDLSEWALTINHSLESKTIPALGNVVLNTHSILDDAQYSDLPSAKLESIDYSLNEYLNPLNTLNNTSYMFNETYRFGIQVKWKDSGKWSAPYYVDDIRFDELNYNINLGDTRRTANNITSNLTDSTNQNIYINYIKFHNINLEYLVSGVPLRQLIEGFRIVRAERIPEVLATGYFILGNSPSTTTRDCFQIGRIGSGLGVYSFDTTDINNATSTIDVGSTAALTEDEPVFYEDNGATATTGLSDETYYYISIVNASEIRLKQVPGGPTVTISASSLGTGYTLKQGNQITKHLLTPRNGSDVLFFHSPDHYYIDRDYQFNLNSDSIKILGPSKTNFAIYGTKTAVAGRNGIYAESTGYFSAAKRAYLTITDTSALVNLEDYALLDTNQEKTLPVSALKVQNKGNLLNDVFALNTPLRPTTGSYFSAGLANSENEGFYYGQIFRNLGADKKYPQNRENTAYHSTGHFYYLTSSNTGVLNNIEVFGGDVYTQKTHLPISLRQVQWHSVMLGCYTQNVVNTQMLTIQEDDASATGTGYRWPMYYDKSTGGLIQPNTHNVPWNATDNIWAGLVNFLYQTVVPQRFYNRSYDYKDRSLVEQGYYLNNRYTGELPTRITWSAKKATGSNKDNYRLGFGPTEFAELDLTYGPIVHHEVINNAFYTLQPFSFQRQYFRDASLVGAQEGTDVVIGSGSILGAPGQELTSIGAEYKWSHIKGQNQSGKESFYWYNNRLKKIMRFAMDGVQPISDRGVTSLLQNNTNWLLDKKYPLSGTGIHGVWNDKYSEAIFTLKAINPNIPAWVTATSYLIGDYVFISPSSTYVHSSGLPYAYKAKTNHTSGSTTKPETGASWQANWTKIVPGTDAYAHTCLSLVYDELKNGFVSTHSYWPDIYLTYQNVFWSPNPNAKNTLFLHDANDLQEYYSALYIPSITAVMNYDPNMPKNFEAIQVNSDLTPSGIDFFTKNHKSYLDETEWDYREDFFYSPIKNDILTAVGGTPVEDTSRLWGKWLKIKMYLESGVPKQKLINFVVKFRPMARLYNQ